MKQTLQIVALVAAIAAFLSPARTFAQEGPSGNGQMMRPPGGASQNGGGPQGGGSQSGGPREACRADAQKFCQDVQPGGGRIKDCLEDHYKEISDACYSALKNMPQHGPGGARPPASGDETEGGNN